MKDKEGKINGNYDKVCDGIDKIPADGGSVAIHDCNNNNDDSKKNNYNKKQG